MDNVMTCRKGGQAMHRQRTLSSLLTALVVFVTSPLVRADLPYPRFDRLTPLGGNAGATVEVEIIGNDIDDVKSLMLDHPGLKAEFVKERFFRISIAADVPPGTYDVR